ncbi:MAG: hypothetical protein COB98_07705 [Flavobacteriaceae bacterium]|nr:MAG: hypothetical protein COB98_07705 [Flavobacteriaceae bacterium]
MALSKAQISKNHIVKTAFILFLEKGYKDITINNIVKASGFSKGAIYHHFASKEAIYYATLDTYYFDLLKNEKIQFLSGDFKNDIKNLYKYICQIFSQIENLTADKLKYPIRNFFSYQLESELNAEIRNQTYETVLFYRSEVLKIVSAAKTNKQIKQDIDSKAISFQILGIIEGLAINNSTLEKDVETKLLVQYDYVFNSFFKLICIE